MYQNHTIAVVVPAYNEETLLGRVIETMPNYVDHIVVVDDCSRDGTVETVRRCLPRRGERLLLIQHETNQGVGGAAMGTARRLAPAWLLFSLRVMVDTFGVLDKDRSFLAKDKLSCSKLRGI